MDLALVERKSKWFGTAHMYMRSRSKSGCLLVYYKFQQIQFESELNDMEYLMFWFYQKKHASVLGEGFVNLKEIKECGSVTNVFRTWCVLRSSLAEIITGTWSCAHVGGSVGWFLTCDASKSHSSQPEIYKSLRGKNVARLLALLAACWGERVNIIIVSEPTALARMQSFPYYSMWRVHNSLLLKHSSRIKLSSCCAN